MKTQKQASFKCLQVGFELVDSWKISQQWCKVEADQLKRHFYDSWINRETTQMPLHEKTVALNDKLSVLNLDFRFARRFTSNTEPFMKLSVIPCFEY